MKRFRGMSDPYELVGAVTGILERGAQLLDLLGDPRLGARLLGSAEAEITKTDYVRNRRERQILEEITSGVRTSVGDAEFDAEFEAGKELDSRDAHDALLDALEESLQD